MMKNARVKQGISISHYLGSLLCFGVFFYFAYHLAHGDQGFFALKGVQDKLARMETEYNTQHAQRVALERQVRLLRDTGIDPDVLDARARVVLGYAHPDEVVVLYE